MLMSKRVESIFCVDCGEDLVDHYADSRIELTKKSNRIGTTIN